MRHVRSHLSFVFSVILGMVFVAAFFALAQTAKKATVKPRQAATTRGPVAIGHRLIRRVLVRGYMSVGVGKEQSHDVPHDIFIPGVSVFLTDAQTGAKSEPAMTDLSGRFTLFIQRERRYRVCWDSASFGSGCNPKVFPATNVGAFLSTVRIPLSPVRPNTAVYGNVRMKDGSLPRTLEPLANTNSFARVRLLDKARNLLDTAYVNNFGEYLLPRVPGKENIFLETVMEHAKRLQPIRRQANLAGRSFQPINLTIGNTPPRIDPVVPVNAAGVRVKVAKPGSTVTLNAVTQDPDGDTVRVHWAATGANGTLSAASGSSVQWTLPSREGRYEVFVIASDKGGGYAKEKLSLRVDDRGIPFSGYVRGTDAPAVGGAEVEVNGQTAVTGPDGFFRIRVKDAARFVFNIRKKGYAFYSKIYDNALTGGKWTLTRATVRSIDPTRNIEVINERRPGDCPGPAALSAHWSDFPGAGRPVWQDGKGNVIRPSREDERSLPPLPFQGKEDKHERQCGVGATVKIPANALVDAHGNAPSGNVDVSISTIDLMSSEQMPGDFTVKMPDGGTQVMQSYGAATIEITSGAARYNLRSGTTATITIPVDPSQIATGAPIPPSIPILFYDERNGVWLPEGEAHLNAGVVYVAEVKHFSTINTDTIKTDQACVRVLSPQPGMPASYDLEVTIPMPGGAAPKVLRRTIDNATPSEHVLYNLPKNTNIVLAAIDNTSNIAVGTFIVNTGDAQIPTSPNLPAGPPYNACRSTVTLSQQIYPDQPVNGEFLQGLFSFEATNLNELAGNPALAAALDTATTNYYQQIDPRGKRLTLDAFKTTNGFGGANEIHAVYANSGDLGFGRDMHCVKNGADVACYVTNYGNINTPDSDDVANAVAQTNPVATVAMEFSQIESPPGNPTEFDDPVRVVKFYVYSADGSTLLKSADLDGYGPRPVPQLCMVCHNGEYPGGFVTGAAPPFNSRDDVKLGSRFLPFDLHYYTFASAPNDKATQQPKFKSLNEQIVVNGNAGTAISEVITKWYANSSDQKEDIVADGWNATALNQSMYKEVVARTCRTCHAAQVTFPALQFKDVSELTDILGSAEQRVCVQHVMPHARVTHRIFWQSVGPHIPGQFEAFGQGININGWQGNLCGTFVGPPPSGFFDANIQPLFNTYGCPACHNGASPPAGLSLAAGVAYGNIVNVDATEVALKRILPNDPANSYLLQKVQGTQSVGGRMPLGCGSAANPCMTQTDIDLLVAWVNGGAPP